MKYDVGKTIYELPNNQIIGVYEEIYDAQLDGDLLYVYSNLISYKARYDFNLEGEEYTKDITLEIYNGVFKELNVKIKDYFEEEVNYALVNNGYKIVDEYFGYQRYKNEDINLTIDFSGLWCYIVTKERKMRRLESVQDLLDIYKERNINAEIKLNFEN